MSPGDTILEVRNLEVDIPIAAGMLHPVRGISLTVARGETLSIVGESGCGKSLTSLALMGLLPKSAIRSADRMEFLGQDIRNLKEREMAALRGVKMAMIFQEPMSSLNPAYTIGNQLTEVYRRHISKNESEARARAILLLERVGISAAASRLSQYPHQLSGGLRQRVMIAMSLMCGPELIIADEPTTALDVTIQAQILHLLAELQDEFKMGMILITHDLGVVARVADKVQVMYAGATVEEGPCRAVFGNPLHPYTSGLMRCIPVPGKAERGSKLGSVPGIVPNLIGDLRGCLFRNRCGHAISACETLSGEPTRIGAGHAFTCRLPPEEAACIAAQEGLA
ncbi:MAG: ABC transporter ATP-binding protein [Ectothiorhodospiraceae bacterium AqS1]|nr:ABC transporter ATP-binding protein [Ectothiorhodospiraceae bacterium AqS1]